MIRHPRHDVLLTGLPRAGTTLVCHLLEKLPDAVALNEPMHVGRFPELGGREAIFDHIAEYLSSTRRSILESGKVSTRHVGGGVPDNSFTPEAADAGLRKSTLDRGEVAVDKLLAPDFLLFVKHTAAYTALLPDLAERFQVFAIVRNPLASLASWNTIDVPIHTGHIPAAENLDPALAAALASKVDAVDRQLHILDWFFHAFRHHLPPEAILRYEDVVASGGKALSVAAPSALALEENLTSKNRNALYGDERLRSLGQRLLDSDGAFWQYYSRDSVHALMAGE